MPDGLYWTIAIAAAFLAGLAKTGVPGLGILVVPLLAMLFPARTSVGALLPLLLIGDIAAVTLFRRHAQWRLLLTLAPWTLAGIAAGAWALAHLDDQKLRPFIGALILVLVALEFLRRGLPWLSAPHQAWFTGIAGVLTGFATTVGNVAGPVMNLFLVGKGMARQEFMGTVGWFFLLINAMKVPVFAHLGMISAGTLRFDALVAPAVILGTVAGRHLLHRLSDRLFHTLILILAAASGLQLLW